jgi:hypothetical protein
MKNRLRSLTETLMKYVKYVEHQYMYEQYYSEMQMSTSPLLDKYETLLNHMMSLLCACRQKMAEYDLTVEVSTINEVNGISYQVPVDKTWAVYECLVVINTYVNDFLTHMQLLVFNGQIF